MVSIICVYNNKSKLEECLLKSLNRQNTKFDLILIDNSKNIYKSMASAYNDSIKKAKGEWLMFVHQDIELTSENWLIMAEREISNINNAGVIGLAGCVENTEGVYTNIRHGKMLEYAGEHRIIDKIKVQSVDECLFFINRKLFEVIKFDEYICDGWHLYGVDYCMEAYRRGYDNFIIPFEANHHSKAVSMDENYFRILIKLLKKNRNCFNNIKTTCGSWSNNKILFIYKLWIKEKVKRVIRYNNKYK